MRVVSISLFVPTADVPHAGGLYVYHHLAWLARDYPVTLLGPATLANSFALARGGVPGVTAHCWPIHRSSRRMGRGIAYLRWVVSGLGPGRAQFVGLLGDPIALKILSNADLIELQFTPCLAWVGFLRSVAPNVPIVVVCHDIETQGTLSRARYSASRRVRMQEATRYVRVRRQEVQWINKTNLALTFSEKDSRYLVSLGVRVPTKVITPFVEIPVVDFLGKRHGKGAPTFPESPRRIIFVAAFDRASNEEGAWWFLQNVWPRVCDAWPGVQLRLVGAHPSVRLRKSGKANVVVTGFVDDLDYEYRSASVAIAPLHTGAGVKFKVLQAMAYGLPVISTTIGAEGIEVGLNDGVLTVADEPAAFAAATVTALARAGDPLIADAARSVVEEGYRFPASMGRIAVWYESLAAGADLG